ncbi:hypothetical protein E2C01_039011 [Portunus trituberculatus]|uniref:Uncharacterized protein n=1 Tax=Portunus trituberculatus TaxID=210409 RepID=A0A5B7FIQ2_PORTR|nr:hypothetical protein [Portunus trituberculatus]
MSINSVLSRSCTGPVAKPGTSNPLCFTSHIFKTADGNMRLNGLTTLTTSVEEIISGQVLKYTNDNQKSNFFQSWSGTH